MTQPALDFVIAALAKIRQTNDHLPRASRIMLAQLQTANTRGVPWPTEPQLQQASNKAELFSPKYWSRSAQSRWKGCWGCVGQCGNCGATGTLTTAFLS